MTIAVHLHGETHRLPATKDEAIRWLIAAPLHPMLREPMYRAWCARARVAVSRTDLARVRVAKVRELNRSLFGDE